MAYSVNWATRIVTIPKADLTLVSLSPEIYELDMIEFWMAIHDIQDGPGMPYRDIMRSSAPITLAGVTYARSIEIVNGYKIEFEDGEYQVNLVNANNNLLDARVQNSVSINAANSAGLVSGGGSGGGSLPPELIEKINQTHAVLCGTAIAHRGEGRMKIYDEFGVQTHYQRLYSDEAGTIPFDGTAAPIHRGPMQEV